MKTLKIFFLLLFCFSVFLSADSYLPAWVLLERGRQLIYSKDNKDINLSDAILNLKEALLIKGIYPEANFYLSKAFFLTGNFEMQKLNLDKALEDSDYLLDKDLIKEILIEKAEYYSAKRDYYSVIDTLNLFLNDFSSEEDFYKFHRTKRQEINFNLDLYLESYLENRRGISGIEWSFMLYRFNNYNVLKAHEILAQTYFDLEAYKLAIFHILVNIIGDLTRLNEYLLYYEPHYEFKNLRSFIAKASEYMRIKNFLEKSKLWQKLLLLANATKLYDDGLHFNRAISVWKLIIDLAPKDSIYFQEARAEIKNYSIPSLDDNL